MIGLSPSLLTARKRLTISSRRVAEPDWVTDHSGDDRWVATTGKDHLNNVEQVFVDVPMMGHWKARVIGFNVPSGSQNYSLVGFPYPDLPDLVASSDDKVSIDGLDQDISFSWSYGNDGSADTRDGFDYQILLSRDFFLSDDRKDYVKLFDSVAPEVDLGPGHRVDVTSTFAITEDDVVDLLGAGSDFEDLLNSDVFLLVRVDSADAVREHTETNNITFVQLARPVDVVLVMDRSGSMSSEVVVSSDTRTKLDLLQRSANLFLDLMRTGAGDHLGLVSFATDSNVDLSDGSDKVLALTIDNLKDAKDVVQDLEAGGATNIRAALEDGIDMVPSGGDTRRKVIIFFSDGMRTTREDPANNDILQRFDDNDIKVFSVGFGTEGGEGNAGLDIDLLETLSNAGEHGFFHVTQSPGSLDKFSVNAAAAAIDAAMVMHPIRDIPGGSTHREEISLGDQDLVVTFILT